MTTELTKAAQQAHTPEHIAGVDHAHELLRRQGYHRDGDYFINVNRRGAEAIHVLTISLIVHAGQLCALTQRPAAQTEREAFERWATNDGAWPDNIARSVESPDEYAINEIQQAWLAVQATTSRASLPAPQQATPDVPETDFGNMATQQAAGEPVGEQISRAEAIRLINALIEGDTLPPSSLELLRELTYPAPGVPEGFALVPIKSDDAILRPFYNCPPEELGLAWDAAMRVAQVRLAAAQAKGADPEDLAAAGVMLMGRRADHA